MKPALLALFALSGVVAVSIGCNGGDLVAPEVSEPLAVTLQYRTSAQGEPIPAIQATAAAGRVTVRVTTGAECATIVTSGIRRREGELSIVSQVVSNPAALCAPIPANAVIDYTGTIKGLSPGGYRVNVFQNGGDLTPRFIGSVTVRVE